MPTATQVAGIAICTASLSVLVLGFFVRMLWKRFGFRFMRAHLRDARSDDPELVRQELESMRSFDDPLGLS